MIPASNLDRIVARAEELRALLSREPTDDAFAVAFNELFRLEAAASRIGELRIAEHEAAQAEALLSDPEMQELAAEELRRLKRRIPEIHQAIRMALLPRDEADGRSAILEVRRASGGHDAGLFAADLFAMYQKHAAIQGWHFEVLEYDGTVFGGIICAIARIAGSGVFGRLKFESGVHRVSRVPVIESYGRLHNSSAKVAVFPEPEDIDLQLERSNLRVDTHLTSVADDSYLNEVKTAVRVTHIPTGIVATAKWENSSQGNLTNAMKILRTRLFRQERDARASCITEQTSLVERRDYDQCIRTYNFPQNRVSDSQTGTVLVGIVDFMQGEIDGFIDALAADEQARRLAAADERGDTIPPTPDLPR